MGHKELPLASGERHVRAFERLGFERRRQTGSHMQMGGHGKPRITIPMHREVRRGTLAAIIEQAGVSVEEYLRAFR